MGDPSQLIVRSSLCFARSVKWKQESERGLAWPDMLAVTEDCLLLVFFENTHLEEGPTDRHARSDGRLSFACLI